MNTVNPELIAVLRLERQLDERRFEQLRALRAAQPARRHEPGTITRIIGVVRRVQLPARATGVQTCETCA